MENFIFSCCEKCLCFIITASKTHKAVMSARMMPRSGHWRCSVRNAVLRNFAKLTGKQLCQNLFFNKVAGLRPETLLKKDSGPGVFL